LTRRQRLDSISEEKQSALKRQLTVWDLIGYGVASTVGAGIFVTIGIVAKNEAGPGIIFSFLFAGFASFLSALCYSELSSRVPVSGSAYTFAYLTLGELVGWFIGWDLTLEYALSASAIARGWAGYFAAALHSFGVPVPDWLDGYELNSIVSISPLAALVCLACTGLLLLGVKESARFNLIITALNILIIAFIVIVGSTQVDTANWKPFLPYGITGTFRGVGTVFFSYIGFDSVSTLAGEVKNPKRNLPIGIIGTLAIASSLYVAVSMVITGIVNYTNLNEDAPLSTAFEVIGMKWASIIVAIGSVTAMTATTLCSLIGQPRIFFQMATDGLMFPLFARVNSKGVPFYGTLITGLVAATISMFFELGALVDMISIGTLMAFIVVCCGVIILRYPSAESPKKTPGLVLLYVLSCIIFSISAVIPTNAWWIYLIFAVVPLGSFISLLVFLKNPIQPPAFKCPLVPFTPCLGILANIWFIMNLPWTSLIRTLIWASLGFLIYFLYGIRNSVLARGDNYSEERSDSDDARLVENVQMEEVPENSKRKDFD